VSYEVKSRSEVKERLNEIEREHGIDSVGDIRRAHGSHRHRIGAVQDAAVLNLHADAAPGQLAADYAALTNAMNSISEQVRLVEALIVEARALARESMKDGHGPIAHAMEETFRRRADSADGAVRALTSYRDELHNLALAIQNTMLLYQRIDSDLVQHLNSVGGQHG
jgi:CRP-like cAMP-binding protein